MGYAQRKPAILMKEKGLTGRSRAPIWRRFTNVSCAPEVEKPTCRSSFCNWERPVRFDPSSDTSCPVYLVLALAHASSSVFVIRFMYIDVQPLAPWLRIGGAVPCSLAPHWRCSPLLLDSASSVSMSQCRLGGRTAQQGSRWRISLLTKT